MASPSATSFMSHRCGQDPKTSTCGEGLGTRKTQTFIEVLGSITALWSAGAWSLPEQCNLQKQEGLQFPDHSFLWEKAKPGLLTLRISRETQPQCYPYLLSLWLSQMSISLKGIPSWPEPPYLSLCKKEFQTVTVSYCCVSKTPLVTAEKFTSLNQKGS